MVVSRKTQTAMSSLRQLLTKWKQNTDACPLIKQIRMLKEENEDVCEQLSQIYRYNPHIREQHYSDSESDIYSDSEQSIVSDASSDDEDD